jgi:hypothetical protein
MGNKISLYGIDDIIKLGKMFEEQGYELGAIFIKDSDLKFKKKELGIHSTDIGKNTVAFALIDNEEKHHRLWFKLSENFNKYTFKNWKLDSESITYKDGWNKS